MLKREVQSRLTELKEKQGMLNENRDILKELQVKQKTLEEIKSKLEQ